jgi:hypothetical protein
MLLSWFYFVLDLVPQEAKKERRGGKSNFE